MSRTEPGAINPDAVDAAIRDLVEPCNSLGGVAPPLSAYLPAEWAAAPIGSATWWDWAATTIAYAGNRGVIGDAVRHGLLQDAFAVTRASGGLLA